jgi:hypothetical protein
MLCLLPVWKEWPQHAVEDASRPCSSSWLSLLHLRLCYFKIHIPVVLKCLKTEIRHILSYIIMAVSHINLSLLLIIVNSVWTAFHWNSLYYIISNFQPLIIPNYCRTNFWDGTCTGTVLRGNDSWKISNLCSWPCNMKCVIHQLQHQTVVVAQPQTMDKKQQGVFLKQQGPDVQIFLQVLN